MDLSELCVVTCISNPVRYRSRYELYRKFEKMVHDAGANLLTVEMAFGDRPHVLTEKSDKWDLQLRSIDELWHKENMLNLGIQQALQVNPKTKYIAWVDADVFPMRDGREWFEETWHQLQHYQVVQMFEWSQDLGPTYNPLGGLRHGFIAKYINDGFVRPVKTKNGGEPQYYSYAKANSEPGHPGHTGFAWAASIDAINSLGGLLDKCILGSGDWHMAFALVGSGQLSIPSVMTDDYKKYVDVWQDMATRHIKRDIGYVSGTIYHYFHGRKVDRKYWDRWKILSENKYSPYTDIKRDAQGLYQLETFDDRQIMLRDQLRMYFRQRNEDATEE